MGAQRQRYAIRKFVIIGLYILLLCIFPNTHEGLGNMVKGRIPSKIHKKTSIQKTKSAAKPTRKRSFTGHKHTRGKTTSGKKGKLSKSQKKKKSYLRKKQKRAKPSRRHKKNERRKFRRELGSHQKRNFSIRDRRKVREGLLKEVNNPKLRNAIIALYKKNAKIGDGGSMDAYRHERKTGLPVGGKKHYKKLLNRRANLIKITKEQKLSPRERKIAAKLIRNINSGLAGR
ncbi:hypothetical protein QQ020_21650 [Fulvivirgaceae bacterium BMA12]|uniref:Uncharacterized protein n=1 Tax=Agaribacillus aureus TaxID=3051825 RepID=A0ABT8LEH4_9BACT|nr:hypothetical protein [Fulvivirgaceae bacterium BMA12]